MKHTLKYLVAVSIPLGIS